jgi:hypothetical protein
LKSVPRWEQRQPFKTSGGEKENFVIIKQKPISQPHSSNVNYTVVRWKHLTPQKSDPEREIEALRRKEGLHLHDAVVEDLQNLGKPFGIWL